MFTRLRWWIAWLLFFCGFISYLDRAALGVAAPLVARDLRLNPAQLGLVFSVFFLGYGLMAFVGGHLSDRVGPKRVLAVCMCVWSVFCGLTGAVFSYRSLLAVRLLFGMGEGPLSATMNKTARHWFPRREQATAIGLMNAGTPLGGAIAGPVVGFLALRFGWRAAFVVIAVLGLLWVVPWLLIASDEPAQHRSMRKEELREIEIEDSSELTAMPVLRLRDYLCRPSVLVTAFAFFTYAYLLYFFLSWFPTYLTVARHLSLQAMSVVTMVPWLLGFVGILCGGILTDTIFRRTGRAIFSRKIVLVVCLAAAGLCVSLAGVVAAVSASVALVTASIFFLYLTGACYWAVVLDTVEKAKVGGVSGFVHLIANFGGILSPAATGLLVQRTGSFTSAFVLAGALAATGAFAVAVGVRAPKAPA